MHRIEPHFRWRDIYVASRDNRSPFYGREYSEFFFTNKIYNYVIHPQWDAFGSDTLYLKILFVDYDKNAAIIEFIGEWNDCITNDIMHLKRNVIDHLIQQGITKYLLIMENVLNYHADEDDYYQEWYEEVTEEAGWICFVNTLEHVAQEMEETNMHYYASFGENYNRPNWRIYEPEALIATMETMLIE